ncbi:MAG: cell wall-binding repeat-containing protein, partial [Acidimicrobiales bacterium]
RRRAPVLMVVLAAAAPLLGGAGSLAGVGGGLPIAAAATPALAKVMALSTPAFRAFYSSDLTTEAFSSAAVGDVDGDGQPDIVAGFPDGMLYAWHTDGTRFLSFDAGQGAIQGSPVLADLHNDGKLDIIVNTTAGRIVAIDGAGHILFDQHDLATTKTGFFSTPTVADLDGDGTPEIIASSFDHHLHVWRLDGTELPGFPLLLFDTLFSSPVVADINGDGRPEIIVGGDCAGVQGQPCFDGVNFRNHGGYVWAIEPDASVLWRHFIPGQVVWSSPAVADLFGDGRQEVLVGTGLNYPDTPGDPTPGWKVYGLDSGGGDLPGWPVAVGGRVMASPAIGDIDGDGTPDVVTLAEDGQVYAHDPAGHLLAGWPKCVASKGGACPVALHASVTIADVFGTGHQQVVVGGEKWERVLDGGGGTVAETVTDSSTFPLTPAPTVANVGGQAWIVQSSIAGNGAIADHGVVWVWTTGTAPGLSAWPAFKHDPRRTGVGFLGSVAPARPVSRAAGPDRYATAAATSSVTFKPGAPIAYVATGVNFPDALAGTPAAIVGKGPILLTTPGSLPGTTVTELQRLKPGRIVVLGGPDVVSDAVASQLAQYTTGGVSRLQGNDRYATSAAVSAAAFPTPGVPFAYVATGDRFPDALSGGAAAGKRGGPVLLVTRDSVPASVQNELTRLQPGTIIVLGGNDVVSDNVASQLALSARGGGLKRIAGSDRYQTSAAVALDAFGPPTPVVAVATGLRFPDALGGGVAAGTAGGPLLLVPGSTVPTGVRDEINRLGPASALVLGGTDVVSDLVEYQLGF